ncbi:MAG: hypothetical protein AB8B58_10110 [Roseobacter sp.]
MPRLLQENPTSARHRHRSPTSEAEGARDTATDTPQALLGLAQLQRAAAGSPSTRNIQALQRRADQRGMAALPGQTPQRRLSRHAPLTQLRANPAGVRTGTSRLAMKAAMVPEDNQGPVPLGIPMAGEIALQRVATSAQEPMPGTRTAMGSPMLDAMGVDASTMSNAEYARWSKTIQCKMGMHGKMQVGGQTIVTQFRPNADVVQRVSFFQKHKTKFNAGLVMFEAALTIAAAIVGITAAASTGALNLMLTSVAGAFVGVIKLIRGIIMMQQAFKPQDEKSRFATFAIDCIRLTEAAGAAIALVLAAPGALTVAVGAIFAAAKALRSLSVAYAADIDDQIEILKLRDPAGSADAIAALNKKKDKAKTLGTVCHWVEVVALAVGGSTKIVTTVIETAATGVETAATTGAIVGGALGMGVAGSKGVRASGVLAPDAPAGAGPGAQQGNDAVAAQGPGQDAPNPVPELEQVPQDEDNLAGLVNDDEQEAKVEV